MSQLPRPPLYPDLTYLGSAGAFVEEVLEVLHEEPMFEDFSRQEIEMLCHFLDCYAAPREARLIGEGDEGHHMLVILTGEVIVKKVPDDAMPVVMARVGPGGCLGEMSLIDGQRRFASCVTLEPVDFAVLTRARLNDLLVDHPRLANKLLIKLLQIMVGRLRDTGMLVINKYAPII